MKKGKGRSNTLCSVSKPLRGMSHFPAAYPQRHTGDFLCMALWLRPLFGASKCVTVYCSTLKHPLTAHTTWNRATKFRICEGPCLDPILQPHSRGTELPTSSTVSLHVSALKGTHSYTRAPPSWPSEGLEQCTSGY